VQTHLARPYSSRTPTALTRHQLVAQALGIIQYFDRSERTSRLFWGAYSAVNGMTLAAFAGIQNRPQASIIGRRFSRASSRGALMPDAPCLETRCFADG
jgi:hypothetical protein